MNSHTLSVSNYRSGFKVVKRGSSYWAQSPYLAATSGGGEDGAVEGSFLLAGNWKPPVVKADGEGGQALLAETFPKPNASHLQPQHLVMRIECNSDLANKILNLLDIAALQRLVSNP